MKTTLADQIRLGSDVARIKARLPRKKWKLLVKTAHKQGFTVGGALSDVPNSLKERTKSSLVKEAQKTVAQAYKPQEQEATRQQVRLDALAAKRRADDETYRQWLTTQTDDLTAKARAADVALNGLNQTAAAAAKQDVEATKQELLTQAQGLAGVVSDPHQSTAINDTYVKAAQSSADQVGHAAEKGTTTAAGNVNAQDFLKAAVLANASAQRAKTEGQNSGDQEKLNEAIAALKTAKTGDLQKQITALLSNEATKANSNREFAAAAQQLGFKREQLNLDKLKEKHDFQLAGKKLDLEKWKLKNPSAWQKMQNQLGYDKIASTEGQKAADRAARKWIATHGKSARGGGKGSEGDTDAYRAVQTIRGQIKDLYKKFPNGRTKTGRDFRQVLRGRGYDDVMLDIAFDLQKNKGKLSPGMVKKAQTLKIARYYDSTPGPPTP